MSTFSIIIPVYNGEKTIARTIGSCLNQTIDDYEVIVIDNGSSDRTKQIVTSYKDKRIKYHYTSQKGRSNARNLGIKLSKGKYIQFLDADDELSEKKLEYALRIFKKNHKIDGIQTSSVYVKENEEVYVKSPYSKKDFYKRLHIANTIPINSLIIKKRYCKKFPEDLEHLEDWFFWIESLRNTTIYFDDNFVGSIINIHDSNTSKDVLLMRHYTLLVMLRLYNKKLPIKYKLLKILFILRLFIVYELDNKNKITELDNIISSSKILKTIKLTLGIKIVRDISEVILRKYNNSLYNEI